MLTKIRLISAFFLCLIGFQRLSSQSNSFYLDSLIRVKLPKYNYIFNNSYKYRLQIIYTRITRDKNNNPHFENLYWHADSTQFFYPASLVKLPVSIIALQKINELKNYGVNKYTAMITDSVFVCQKKVFKDTTSESRMPSIAQYIKKMFLVSDNYSFARTYEFLGCDYLHQSLEDWGYPNIRIVNRLDGQCKADTAKITSPVYFLSDKCDTLYKQSLQYYNYNKAHPLPNAKMGIAHANDFGHRVSGPKDFSTHNFMSLINCHDILKRLVFYNHEIENERYKIRKNDWKFLMTYLGMYPRECEYPCYDVKTYYDSFKKYVCYGSSQACIALDTVRVFNIVGRAYGFLSDVAYIADYTNKVEYMLSATIYVNERNIVGTGKYEYDKIGLPFLKDLGNLIHETEKNRKLDYKPDLSEFNFFEN